MSEQRHGWNDARTRQTKADNEREAGSTQAFSGVRYSARASEWSCQSGSSCLRLEHHHATYCSPPIGRAAHCHCLLCPPPQQPVHTVSSKFTRLAFLCARRSARRKGGWVWTAACTLDERALPADKEVGCSISGNALPSPRRRRRWKKGKEGCEPAVAEPCHQIHHHWQLGLAMRLLR